VNVEAIDIRLTSADWATKVGSAGIPVALMTTVPAVCTSARQAKLASPVGIPAASDVAVAPTQVTATPPTSTSDARVTLQAAGSVAAATASS